MNRKVASIIWVSVIVAVCLGTILGGVAFHQNTAAAESEQQSVALPYSVYDFNDNTGYNYALGDKRTTLSNGYTTLGKLSVQGKALTKSTYTGVTAIGLDEGTSLTFTYKQSVKIAGYNGHTWHLGGDSATSISGYNTGTIGNGAILVLSSNDKSKWSYVTSMVGINDKTFTFTPSASDVKQGKYYRFLSAAEIYYTYQYENGYHYEYPSAWCRFWGYWGKKVIDYATASVYRNLGQETTVYVCMNTADVAFTSATTEAYTVTDEDLTSEQIEFLQKGATLVDGSTSCSYISVNNFGCKCYSMTYRYNDEEEKAVSSGSKFTAPGRYSFTIRTPLGKTKKTTLYLLGMSEDNGYSAYFADGFVDASGRMYDDTIGVPTYALGKRVSISPKDAYLPGLYGRLVHYADYQAIAKDEHTIVTEFEGLVEPYSTTLDEEGIYVLDCYSSNPNVSSGDLVHYTFCLLIRDPSEYAPSVNYNLLTSAARNVLFSRKVLAVSLKTGGGGAFVYCFPFSDAYYDLAYSVAESIEMLSVEEYEDGAYYYYKHTGSNTKQRYTTKHQLFNAISSFAKQNVCALYLESDVEYLAQPADADTLRDLASQSIRHDVCVVTDETIKKAIQADELYVNDFAFTQVGEFESNVVMALDEALCVHHIPYGVVLDTLFDATQRLRITETNLLGSRVYDVIYYRPDDNMAQIVMTADGVETVLDFDNGLEANSVSIASAGDAYDSQSIIAIETEDGTREVMLLSECEGYGFAPDQTYVIKVTNRFGNTKSTIVVVNREQADALATQGTDDETDDLSKRFQCNDAQAFSYDGSDIEMSQRVECNAHVESASQSVVSTDEMVADGDSACNRYVEDNLAATSSTCAAIAAVSPATIQAVSDDTTATALPTYGIVLIAIGAALVLFAMASVIVHLAKKHR